MITRDVLRAITPSADKAIVEAIPERKLSTIGEDTLLRDIAGWSEAFRQQLADSEGYIKEISQNKMTPIAYGIGIIDWHAPHAKQQSDDLFPTVEHFRLGVAVYHANDLDPIWTTIGSQSNALPVAILKADFTENAHPKGGKSAALIDIGGIAHLLTARHVVANKVKGSRVRVSCQYCNHHCYARVTAKAPGYIDAAALEFDHYPHCALMPMASTTATVACPTEGLAIRNYFGPSGSYVKSTIMQGLSEPGKAINPVAPRTFLTDILGQAGDSGSAVSTDPHDHLSASNTQHGPDLVGIHLGKTDVELETGQIIQRSYALDVDEALRLFKANLIGGILT